MNIKRWGLIVPSHVPNKLFIEGGERNHRYGLALHSNAAEALCTKNRFNSLTWEGSYKPHVISKFFIILFVWKIFICFAIYDF